MRWLNREVIHKYKDLDVWKRSIKLTVGIYKITKAFPTDEKFGLTSQMRRSAVSIPSNIAEGGGRKSNKEFLQFLCIAYASLCELETQVLISAELEIISLADVTSTSKEIEEIQKMIYALMNKFST